MVASVMVPAWGRCVFSVLAISVLFGVAGESALSGYALVPAIYQCITPPVGGRRRRVLGALTTGVLVAVMVTVAAPLSGSTAATAIGLAVVGFGSALPLRIGPVAASMQLALIIAFAYSVGHPLDDASAVDRGLAVLAALPIPCWPPRSSSRSRAASAADPRRRRRAGRDRPGPGTPRGRDRGAATARFRGALGRLRDRRCRSGARRATARGWP
jgi:hypothetical protein